MKTEAVKSAARAETATRWKLEKSKVMAVGPLEGMDQISWPTGPAAAEMKSEAVKSAPKAEIATRWRSERSKVMSVVL